jgi:MoxR-like ATPase
MQNDSNQLLAAKKILSNPITLISGRGGTGKTEVVTAVLEAIELAKSSSEEESLFENSLMSEEQVWVKPELFSASL